MALPRARASCRSGVARREGIHERTGGPAAALGTLIRPQRAAGAVGSDTGAQRLPAATKLTACRCRCWMRGRSPSTGRAASCVRCRSRSNRHRRARTRCRRKQGQWQRGQMSDGTGSSRVAGSRGNRRIVAGKKKKKKKSNKKPQETAPQRGPAQLTLHCAESRHRRRRRR